MTKTKQKILINIKKDDYSIILRNTRTQQLNNELKKHCKDNNIYFCSINSNIIDSNKRVYNIFKAPINKNDCHVIYEWMQIINQRFII
jgi:hypothetical protein